MRAVGLSIFALLFPFAAAAQSADSYDIWFRIRSPDGSTIGWQHEQKNHGGAFVTERQLSYRVHGHARVEETLVTILENDRSVVPVISAATHPKKIVSSNFRTMKDAKAGTIVVRYVQGYPAAAWRVTPDSVGAMRIVTQINLGADMRYEVSPHPLSEADISPRGRMPHAMVASPYVITRAARRGHLRFRFGLPSKLSALVPATAAQRVSDTNGDLVFDICETCGATIALTADQRARYTQPTQWLESDASELQKAIRSVKRPELTDVQRMAKLQKIARERLSGVDFEGYASARQAWRDRHGDCTEDALLLTALARAAGIPARVVSGLVYGRERYHGTHDAFLPHAWTIAWVDGAWRNYDISINGFGSGHIALAVGDGEPAATQSGWTIGALLDWRSMAEVRSAPTPRP